MAGNRLGARQKYLYNSDGGNIYRVETDESLALAGTGIGEDPPTEYVPGVTGGDPKPLRFQERVVFAQAADGARKELICFDPTSALYATDVGTTVSIDGEAGWVITGRRGEKLTF